MAEDNEAKFEFFKSRISSAFPKLAGAKLDKLLAADEIKEAMQQFCDDDQSRCMVVPENMKFDKVIPSKLGKGKVLVFIKLQNATLNSKNMNQNVIIIISCIKLKLI